jgi:hypothetical protein
MTRYMIIVYHYWQIKGVFIIIIYVFFFFFDMFVLHMNWTNKFEINLIGFEDIWFKYEFNQILFKFYWIEFEFYFIYLDVIQYIYIYIYKKILIKCSFY